MRRKLVIGIALLSQYCSAFAATIAPGVEFSTVEMQTGKKAHLVKIKKNTSEVTILSAEIASGSADPDAFFVNNFAERNGAIVVLSGGYMASYSPPTPLGFVRVGGRIISKAHKSWLGKAEFCTNKFTFFVGSFSSAADQKQFPDCLQAGPLFIQNGVNRYKENRNIDAGERSLLFSVQDQTFVCKDLNQDLWLGLTEKIRLDQLAEFAISKLKCVDAMRLTGYTTAALQVGSRSFGPGEFPLHNVIAVLQRKH